MSASGRGRALVEQNGGFTVLYLDDSSDIDLVREQFGDKIDAEVDLMSRRASPSGGSNEAKITEAFGLPNKGAIHVSAPTGDRIPQQGRPIF